MKAKQPRRARAASMGDGLSKFSRTGSNGSSTRETILSRSIYLFNRSGVQAVSLGMIAKHMKISPGNLTYHFPRKRELLRAILPLLENDLRVALASARTDAMVSPAESALRLINIFQTLWTFRFFFNEIVHVLTSDSELRRQYSRFGDWALATLETDLRRLERLGYFHAPLPPNNFRWLAENIWNLWLSWLRRTQVASPLAEAPRKDALHYCAIHYWSLIQQWLQPQYAQDLLRELEQAVDLDQVSTS